MGRRYMTGAQIREKRLREIQLEKDYPVKKRAKPRKFPDVKAPRLVCQHLKRKGNICRFISNDPGPCRGICPNWCTFNAKFIREWGRSKNVKREYMDWADLMHSPKYKGLLAGSEHMVHKDKVQQVLI